MTKDYLRLEMLIQKVVSPYLGTYGLYSSEGPFTHSCILGRGLLGLGWEGGDHWAHPSLPRGPGLPVNRPCAGLGPGHTQMGPLGSLLQGLRGPSGQAPYVVIDDSPESSAQPVSPRRAGVAQAEDTARAIAPTVLARLGTHRRGTRLGDGQDGHPGAAGRVRTHQPR